MNARLGTGHWGYGPRVALLHSSEAGLGVLELFEQSGRNVERATVLLRDLLAEWPDGGPLATELVACDHDGDRIAHDIIDRLHDGRSARRGLDSFDGYELATGLDDVVDDAEQTADMLGIYQVEAPMEQAGLLADVLVAAGEQVAAALRALPSAATWSRSTAWRTRATASAATRSPRCSPPGSTRWS